jgi:hypothetical protein
MPLGHYNAIAGRSVERLAALSDGIFAVAMTLLVLDLRVPAAETLRSENGLWVALLALSPPLIVYLMSFLTLGIFWVGQQTSSTNWRAAIAISHGFIGIFVCSDADAVFDLAGSRVHRLSHCIACVLDQRAAARRHRIRCAVVRYRHCLEHRVHHSRAAQLPIAPRVRWFQRL